MIRKKRQVATFQLEKFDFFIISTILWARSWFRLSSALAHIHSSTSPGITLKDFLVARPLLGVVFMTPKTMTCSRYLS